MPIERKGRRLEVGITFQGWVREVFRKIKVRNLNGSINPNSEVGENQSNCH